MSNPQLLFVAVVIIAIAALYAYALSTSRHRDYRIPMEQPTWTWKTKQTWLPSEGDEARAIQAAMKMKEEKTDGI